MRTASIYRSETGRQEVMSLYDKVLALWPVPFETLNIPTRHGNTFVIASGPPAGRPLILLHGSCSNAVSWIGEAGRYSRDFRTYAVDIPGEPGRSAPNRPSWNSPAYAEWMEDLLKALNISRVSLLGISQGGWTALKFATIHPERVEKLVLISPAGITTDKLSFLLKAILYSQMGRRGAIALNRLTFGRGSVDAGALDFMTAIMTYFRPRIGRLELFTDEELKRLTMPVLLLGGAQDSIRNVEKIAVRLGRLHPGLLTHIYPDRGHVLVNVSEQVVPFLQSGSVRM
jgi:pimeloyl-ACP methyl ester carboxylesterase